jgi:hypothetical protein
MSLLETKGKEHQATRASVQLDLEMLAATKVTFSNVE